MKQGDRRCHVADLAEEDEVGVGAEDEVLPWKPDEREPMPVRTVCRKRRVVRVSVKLDGDEIAEIHWLRRFGGLLDDEIGYRGARRENRSRGVHVGVHSGDVR